MSVRKIKGNTAYITVIIDSFVIPEATNKLSPKGGVIVPTAILAVITTPKWTGFTPNLIAIGDIRGAQIIVPPTPSINIPDTRKRRLVAIQKTTNSASWEKRKFASC